MKYEHIMGYFMPKCLEIEFIVIFLCNCFFRVIFFAHGSIEYEEFLNNLFDL